MSHDERQDLYAVLGVARDADEDTLRKAYRKLARRFHPDVNPGDAPAEERFKAISEAYGVLSDEQRRAAYDEFGEVSLEAGFDVEKAREAREAFGARFGGAPGGAGYSGEEAFHFGGLEDLFGDLFSRRGWSEAQRARRGPDLDAELELDFMDAVHGGERRITLMRPRADGSAAPETVTVRIPAGVSDGGSIRLRGKGGEGLAGGPAGDLNARIRVRPHRLFRREGRDVTFDLPVSLREATLGAEIKVPTLDGRVTLRVPAGTDSGARLRLRGKGVSDPTGGPAGDLYAVVQIRVPKDLPPDLVEALEKLAEHEPADLREELGS